MNNIFEQKPIYSEGWNVVEEREFNAKELAAIDEKAVVVDGEYGLSARFHLKKGGHIYIPLSKDSQLGEGEEFDVKDHKLVELASNGKPNITKLI